MTRSPAINEVSLRCGCVSIGKITQKGVEPRQKGVKGREQGVKSERKQLLIGLIT